MALTDVKKSLHERSSSLSWLKVAVAGLLPDGKCTFFLHSRKVEHCLLNQFFSYKISSFSITQTMISRQAL
jgi:hypothetical protein